MIALRAHSGHENERHRFSGTGLGKDRDDEHNPPLAENTFPREHELSSAFDRTMQKGRM
jgi:hypothetical protein